MNKVLLVLLPTLLFLIVSCTSKEIETNPVPPIEISFEQPQSDATPLLKVTEYGQCEQQSCYEYILHKDGFFTAYKTGNGKPIAHGQFSRLKPDFPHIDHTGLVLLQDRLCPNFKTDVRFEYLDTEAVLNPGPTQFTCTKSDDAKFLRNYGSVEDILGLYYGMDREALRSLDPAFIPSGTLLFQIVGSGGCARGPNTCSDHYLFDDGKFITKELGSDWITDYGQIDLELIEKWTQTTDYKRLTKVFEDLGEGHCASCTDGIDIYYSIYTPDGILTVNSAEKGFNDDDFFKITAEVGQAIWENSQALYLHERKQ